MRRVKSSLHRFIQISNRQRRLLLLGIVTLLITRAALVVAGASAARRAARVGVLGMGHHAVGHLSWAVGAASRYVPGATCLTQALALEAMLVRTGHRCRVEIGVAKDEGVLQAHAWVVSGHLIVLGGPDVGRYRSIGSLE